MKYDALFVIFEKKKQQHVKLSSVEIVSGALWVKIIKEEAGNS